MKILVTGFNALAIGTARSPLNIATSARILPKVLQELGHDVTQKQIIPGEDVSMYDKVFVFVFGPNSLSARYWYGAAYTIIKRPDSIISIDDWQTKDSVSGFRTFSNGHWRIWKKVSQAGNPVGKVNWEEAQPYKKEIEDLVDYFAHKEWPHKLLVPAYDGGNYEELGMKAKEIINWDPSAYTDTYLKSPDNQEDLLSSYAPNDGIKENAWICASLVSKQSWLEKQEFNWRVKTFGNQREKQTRLKEHEMFQEYRKVWGVISPPHYHTAKGSGWWRVRYKMALDAKCIVHAHPEEAKILGINCDLNKVENSSKEELLNISREHMDAFKKKFWNRERTKEFFKWLLEEKS
tara:strand:- start:2665 stop:3711 length:1047 start_codon:yes stop_codon:yes gene_type:complete